MEGDVSLGENVVIGPYCVLDGTAGPISIGAGTRLIASVHLCGPLSIGEGNTIYPQANLGFSPQDLKWDPAKPGAGLALGDGNTFRECATVHRATSEEFPTVIGDRNYFMAGSHAGHDTRVGNDCVLANAALLGGFVVVDDRVTIGGGTGVHQFCHIGRGTMLSGGVALMQDLPPFFMLTGINFAGSINLIGLRRSGASAEMIGDVRWAFRTLYRSGLSMKSALGALHDRVQSPMINEYIAFIEQSKRGICPGRASSLRGSALPA